MRNFFNSYQCLGIRNFGCAYSVNSLLDDRKQKARDRCVLSSCGPVIAQTETCTLSTINFLSHCIFKLKLKHMPCCASSDSFFFFFGGGGEGVINIACVLCGCFTGESWLKTEKKNERDKEIKQCMRTISPSCDVFSFLFIYLFIFGWGGEYCQSMCYVNVFHWWHKKKKKKKKKNEMWRRSQTMSVKESVLHPFCKTHCFIGLNDHVNQIRQKRSMRSLGCKNTKSYM